MERLLDAAYSLLVQRGYQATTQDISRRSGLSTRTLYTYYATKEELLVHALLRSLAAAPGCPASADDWDVSDLEALLAGHVAAPPAAEHRVMTEAAGVAVGHLETYVRRLADVVRRWVEAAVADGRIDRSLSIDAVVAVVVDLYLGAITSKSFDRPQPSEQDVLSVLSGLGRGRPGAR